MRVIFERGRTGSPSTKASFTASPSRLKPGFIDHHPVNLGKTVCFSRGFGFEPKSMLGHEDPCDIL